MEKGKVWYVKEGIWYEGNDLVGIFATYEEALKCYERKLNEVNGKIYSDYYELWEADLDTQEYDMIDSWSRDDD